MNIDVVILWVNSSDEVWKNKINQYLENKIDWDDKEESTRYNSINEIEISITSVIKNASFIRNIFVVTDNQKPKKFEELKELAKKSDINLKLIDHKDIFTGYEKYLPTFNNRSIEALMYRIKGLSEHFLYANDDMFVNASLASSFFFKNGTPVVRMIYDPLLKWEIQLKKALNININTYRLAIENAYKNKNIDFNMHRSKINTAGIKILEEK
mgnify:CR=1 FL=1